MNNGGNPTYTVLINLCKSGLDVVTKVKDTHNMKEGYLLSSSRCLEYPSHGTPWPDRASAPPCSIYLLSSILSLSPSNSLFPVSEYTATTVDGWPLKRLPIPPRGRPALCGAMHNPVSLSSALVISEDPQHSGSL